MSDMSAVALGPERIRELYRLYTTEDPYQPWRSVYISRLTHVQGFDRDALTTPTVQQELWSLRDMATLGPGDSVNVQGTWTDPEIVAEITDLKQISLPSEDGARADKLQSKFLKILRLVTPHHSSKRPWAKLGRLFAALLPREMHSGFSSASRVAIGRILRGATGDGWVHGHVLDRARLREILGPEESLDDDVWRSTFCWWLHDNAESITKGEVPSSTPQVEEAPSQLPPLQLLPGPRLRRGMVAFQGYAETVRIITESAQGGAAPDDIIEALLATSGYETMVPTHARRIFRLVRNLGLLEHRGGLWYPSRLGERLLDDPRYDPLAEKMLAEIFGFAHFLRFIATEPMKKKAMFERLREIYPAWTVNRAPSSIAAWARSLGLVRLRDDRRFELTEYGEEWESRLPAELPVPPLRSGGDDGDILEEEEEEEDGEGLRSDAPSPDETAAPRPAPRLAELVQRIAAANADFVQDSGVLQALHLAWHGLPGKRFVIFSGLSGTGKTLLFKLYAEAYCQHQGIAPDAHLEIVPVSPDWRDPSGLLGYFNALHADPTYQAEPALRLILQAQRHPKLPYFLILDEMNLARVEHYFAPFLSAMETGGDLCLHANDDPVNKVPPKIPWPRNLFIGGTVNMDETTYSISDKVLDRAFTIEFWEVALPDYFTRRASNGRPRHDDAEAALLSLHGILRKVRRHFGYRTAGEVLAMLDAAQAEGIAEDAQRRVLDQAIFSKVLPRIRGQESDELSVALRDAEKTCMEAGLTRSAEKLAEMTRTLRATGLTKFWA